MADFIFDEFKDDDNVVPIRLCEHKNPLTSVLKSIRLKAGNRRGLFDSLLFGKDFVDRIAQIGPDDRVLLWSIENLKMTMLLAKEINSKNILSFLWNPMFRLRKDPGQARKYMHTLNELGIELCTFDSYDSKMLNCRTMPQVHRRIDLPEVKAPDFDVFFVGQLKGREKILSQLIPSFNDNGISYRLHLVAGRHEKAEIDPCLKDSVKDCFMSYSDTLDHINRSRCLLDLSQDGQQGLTLRPFEAMMYRKKLITNNPPIKNEPFYNPDNILVIGDPDDKRTFAQFVTATPYTPIAPELEQPYLIRPWLDNLWGTKGEFARPTP